MGGAILKREYYNDFGGFSDAYVKSYCDIELKNEGHSVFTEEITDNLSVYIYKFWYALAWKAEQFRGYLSI